jgi:tetratricopeptide (TPR) repeat protein
VIRWLLIAAAVALAGVLLWRPIAAWWCDDEGSLEFVRGNTASAAGWFSRGLLLEPAWHLLLEDHGRAILDADPATALVEFREADCGEPCTAEAGDAEIRLGRAQDAVDDYLSSHAVGRLARTVEQLGQEHRYDEAIALERALAARLGTGMLAQADLASAYATIGSLDVAASKFDPLRSRAFARDAIRSYRRASLLAPFNEGYLLALGFSELQWGDRRRARAAFERELDLHPHQTDAERGLAQAGGAAAGGL